MKIFLICPVRNATQEQKDEIEMYIQWLVEEGHYVYYPARDTDQNDPTGYRICSDNDFAIQEADAVHLFWDKNSTGSLFDLGMAFSYGKPLVLANPASIEPNHGKSWENFICDWAFRSENFEKD